MVLNARREDARRLDMVCCIKTSTEPNRGACGGACGGKLLRERPSKRVMRFIGRQYVRWPVKIVVIVIAVGLLAAGIVGTSQMRVEADVNDFIPEGTYLREWLDVDSDYFQTTGTDAGLYFVSTEATPIDFSTAATQQAMTDAIDAMLAEPVVLESSLNSWLAAFQAYQQAQGQSATGVRAFRS